MNKVRPMPEETRAKLGLVLAGMWAYFSAVLLLGEYRMPFEFGPGRWLLSTAFVLLIGDFLAHWMLQRRVVARSALTNFCLLGTTVVVSLMVLDTAYSVYLNSQTSSEDPNKARVFDENVWVSELYPKVFYPTRHNFALHKPNVQVSGPLFGNFYSKSMLTSPTLVESVLEKHHITIKINELGFRESSHLGSSDILTLGDSFTFGWGVNEQESWPGLLESQLDTPIYNLGIHDASPRQELELLKYVLQENGEQIRIRKLLWMIYEGNDLEDDYTEEVRRDEGPVKTPLTEGTLIAALNNFVRTIQRQSVISRLRRGQINWNKWARDPSANPNFVDGVELVHPLYYSHQLGPRLFYQYYVDLAGEPESYIATHWNRDAVEAVIREMRDLADKHNFEVAVIVAPSAARLHGPYFENFPEISSRPHFLDFFLDLSSDAGFATINLYELMKPYAEAELLYFRDDDHFNHRGNELAAELIQQELFEQETPL